MVDQSAAAEEEDSEDDSLGKDADQEQMCLEENADSQWMMFFGSMITVICDQTRSLA